MKKHELILHIGSHKTGTTALQNSLHLNKKFLRENGIYYDNYYLQGKMHHNLAFGLFKEALEDNLIYYPKHHYYFTDVAEQSSLVIERIKNDIHASNIYHKIIISSEGLFGPGNFFAFHSGIKLNEDQQQKINEYVALKLKSLLSEFDVEVVCYLRRQDQVLESFYNQYCKDPDPDNELPLPNFEEYWNTRPVVMNYYDEMSMWAKYFGKENIIVRPYEKKQLPAGVINDFYINVLGFSEGTLNEVEPIDDSEKNSRFNRDVLEYRRLLNIKGLVSEFHKLSKVMGNTGKNQNYLTREDREKILISCENSNQKVASEYLSRNNEGLFFDYEIKDYEEYGELSLEKSIEISNKLINLFLYEKKSLETYLNSCTQQIDHLNYDINRIIEERDSLSFKLNTMIVECESLSQERDLLTHERERLKQERDAIIAERERIEQERDAVIAERERLKQERDVVIAEKEQIKQERDVEITERERIIRDRNESIAENDKLKREINTILVERERLKREMDVIILEIDVFRQERDLIHGELMKFYNSKSWKLTKPLRFLWKTFKKFIKFILPFAIVKKISRMRNKN